MEKRGDHLTIFTVSSDKRRNIPPFRYEFTDASQYPQWRKYG